MLLGVLAWPMLFTNSGLMGDWEHHLWFVWRESLAISANHSPSMFLNTKYSVFYPQFAFYGGTLFALAGTLAVVLGEAPEAAYIITYILAFAAAYGGWYWIARGLGLGRWLAQIPALLFVTSGCYLTLVYGEGDWPEFVAMSMIPLMVASGLSVLRGERLRLLPAAALAASSLVFFGSHILTVLWGSTLLALTGAAVLALVPDARRRVRRRGLIRLAVVVIPALLVSAWFLLPMLAYSSHTRIGGRYNVAYTTLRATMDLVELKKLFTLSHATTIPGYPDYVLALPTVTMAWVLVSIALLLRRGRGGAWRRALLIFAVMTTGVVVLMTHEDLILDLPKPYTLLQFTYRLEGYVLMGVSAAVIAILALLRSGSKWLRMWSWTVVPVLAVSMLGAIQQLDAYPRTEAPRFATFTESAETVYAEHYIDYTYFPLPFISEVGLPSLRISPSEIHDNHLSLTFQARPGQLVATNIAGGANLLNIHGASIAGSDARSQLVLAVGAASAGSVHPHTPVSNEHISVSPAQPLPIVLGRALSFLGAAMLLVLFAVLSLRGYRARREALRERVTVSRRESSELGTGQA
jgi:uncharacterized membrane protein